MSNAKHTPGPWKVWNDRVWTDEPMDEMVAICVLSGNRGDRDANAALCAAAPDLLAALAEVSGGVLLGISATT